MAKRRLPHRPSIDHARRQAKALLADYRRGSLVATEDFQEYHPGGVEPDEARLSDAQLVLARSYRFTSWPRLKTAIDLLVAIDGNDTAGVHQIVSDFPAVLTEGARGLDTAATWGVPFAYAMLSERPEIAALLASFEGKDLEAARRDSVRVGLDQLAEWFIDADGQPKSLGVVMHPCELLNPDGLQFLLDQGAELVDESGDRIAPVARILRTYSRNPIGRRGCLEICLSQGVSLPDTPVTAFFLGRIERLAAYLKEDPGLLRRRFSLGEIFPPSLGFDQHAPSGLSGTPLDGSTLLHLCGEYGDIDTARWLLANGADPNTTAGTDSEGFGGHTALFNTVVTCCAYGHQSDTIAGLLLDAGADPHRRASLRKRLQYADDETMHEYRNVTALEWGRRFHARKLVNKAALRLVAKQGGV